MREYYSLSRKISLVIIYGLLAALCIGCLVPFLHVLALSLSHKVPAGQNRIALIPYNFNELTKTIAPGINLNAYLFAITKAEFLQAFIVSIKRIVLAGSITMLIIIMTAYPLSKTGTRFKGRTFYVWFFVVTMLVSGGLIPWYIIINKTGLYNTIWALVIPGAAPPFSIVLLLNFFRGIPPSLEESAYLDGADHWRILWKIYVPLSLPAIATLALFTIVGNWNAWFDGLILMKQPKNYPLQSYLQTLLASTSMTLMTRAKAELLKHISEKTFKAAQIFIGAVPMLMLYPFLQRYFMMGIVLGSVKE